MGRMGQIKVGKESKLGTCYTMTEGQGVWILF